MNRSLKVVTLLVSLGLVSSCSWTQGDDPNLKMTFSCFGDRRIEYPNSRGKPDVIQEKISHSITFWRWTQEKRKDGRSPWNKYKVNRFVLDGNFQDLTRHDGLDQDILEISKKTDDFRVNEQFGIFTVRLFTSAQSDPKNRGANDDTYLTFNFITETLNIDVIDRDGTDVWRRTYDRTRCERVTNPDILKEMTVISS
jgi:hypothetical protein